MPTDTATDTDDGFGEIGQLFASAQQGMQGKGNSPSPQPSGVAQQAQEEPGNAEQHAQADQRGRGFDDSDANNPTIRNVPCYLPVDLRALLRNEARRRSMTITDLTLEAFEVHGTNYARLTVTRSPVPGGPPRRVSGRNKDSVQIQLRLDGPQRVWLDTTVRNTGAPTRSALVTAVLRKHFAGFLD